MSEKNAVIVLADGFEEIEAVGTGDVLKRLGCHVIMAGLLSKEVRSSAGLHLSADALLEEVDLEEMDGIILPGGLPGATTLRDSRRVMDALHFMAQNGKVTAAICAAPIALERAGLTEGRTVTGYPGTNAGLSKLVYTGNRVERDGLIVTGKGPGATFDFAMQVALALGFAQEQIDQVFKGMFVLQ